jgi:hypothetical protein
VIVEIDVVVIGPADVGDPAEDRGRMLTERRLKILLGEHGFMGVHQEVRAGHALGRLEHLQSADVHRMLPGFDEQEHRIGGRDQVHRTPRSGSAPSYAQSAPIANV